MIVEILTNIAPGRLTQSKMICIKELVDSKLFKMPECRQILLPVFCKQIKDKLESKEEVRTVALSINQHFIISHILTNKITFLNMRVYIFMCVTIC